MRLKLFVLFILSFSSIGIHAKITMPYIFSNNMLIQRNQPIKVWGWAKPGENIEIVFKGENVKTKSSRKGVWQAILRSSEHGGPYQMTIRGNKDTITYNNVLVGDVWLCSGQSNMEFKVKDFNYTKDEIRTGDYPSIRYFSIQRNISDSPLEDVSGEWLTTTPNSIPEYSAVAYFFGLELNLQTNIPIGLINSSWGGTDIEPWISTETIKGLPWFTNTMRELAGIDLKKEMEDKGIREDWANKPELFTSSMQIPQYLEVAEPGIDGSVWLRYQVRLPIEAENQPGVLSLGKIDDDDTSFVNGKQVGSTLGYNEFRRYTIPANVLKKGNNSIVVNVIDQAGPGGFHSKAEDIYMEVGGQKYPLAGTWQYAISLDSRTPGHRSYGPNSYPTLLYNAMIAPINRYAIKGTIWYQGENNVARAEQYKTLFPALINDWRAKWGYEFPFYWVQLANYMNPNILPPTRSEWAELREAQTITQSLPQTGEAVIIDIGDAHNIHPHNKQDVGKRLAYHALNKNYEMRDIVYASPSFKSMSIKENKVIIEFDNVGSGLVCRNKYGNVNAFAIAGKDKKFHWAQAYIEGKSKIVIICKDVVNPVAVRYAWSNNPDDVNLYNSEGLPACPFRTDKNE